MDRYPLWLQAVDGVLAHAGIATVGRATEPEQALGLVSAQRPDLFIVDIEASGRRLNGLACIREVHDRLPDTKVVALSGFEDAAHIEASLEAGAAVYVFKSASPDDLISAIRQMFFHSIFFANELPRWDRTDVVSLSGAPSLTRREREILRLLPQGRSNAQLAAELWVTEQTVKFHLSNIYRKLNVANRTEAARWALVHGSLRSTSPDAAKSPLA